MDFDNKRQLTVLSLKLRKHTFIFTQVVVIPAYLWLNVLGIPSIWTFRSHGSESLPSQRGLYGIWAELRVIQWSDLHCTKAELYIHVHVNKSIYISFISASYRSYKSSCGFMTIHHGQRLTKSEQNLTDKLQENIRKPTTAIFQLRCWSLGDWQVEEKFWLWDLNLQTTDSLHNSPASYCWATTGRITWAPLVKNISNHGPANGLWDCPQRIYSWNHNLVTSALHLS